MLLEVGPYDGFPVIEETQTDGWAYGVISGSIYSEYPDGWDVR